jgi:hypothetical protein
LANTDKDAASKKITQTVANLRLRDIGLLQRQLNTPRV